MKERTPYNVKKATSTRLARLSEEEPALAEAIILAQAALRLEDAGIVAGIEAESMEKRRAALAADVDNAARPLDLTLRDLSQCERRLESYRKSEARYLERAKETRARFDALVGAESILDLLDGRVLVVGIDDVFVDCPLVITLGGVDSWEDS